MLVSKLYKRTIGDFWSSYGRVKNSSLLWYLLNDDGALPRSRTHSMFIVCIIPTGSGSETWYALTVRSICFLSVSRAESSGSETLYHHLSGKSCINQDCRGLRQHGTELTADAED